MFERIDRVIVPVPDAGRAAAWYEAEFEFRIARRRGKEIDLQVHVGEAKLTLTEASGDVPFHPLRHLHPEGHVPFFNFYTHWEDLHRDWLQARSIPSTDIMTTPYMNVCEMADPDGNVIGICHEKSSSLYYTPHDGPLPPMFHRVLAVFLPVRDLEASIRWYTEALGFVLNNHWGEGADLKIGEGETIVTMIRMEERAHRQAVQSLSDRPYYSLQSSRIHEAYRQLSGRGVTADTCREQDGVRRFHIRSPEGMLIRISEKETVHVV